MMILLYKKIKNKNIFLVKKSYFKGKLYFFHWYLDNYLLKHHLFDFAWIHMFKLFPDFYSLFFFKEKNSTRKKYKFIELYISILSKYKKPCIYPNNIEYIKALKINFVNCVNNDKFLRKLIFFYIKKNYLKYHINDKIKIKKILKKKMLRNNTFFFKKKRIINTCIFEKDL